MWGRVPATSGGWIATIVGCMAFWWLAFFASLVATWHAPARPTEFLQAVALGSGAVLATGGVAFVLFQKAWAAHRATHPLTAGHAPQARSEYVRWVRVIAQVALPAAFAAAALAWATTMALRLEPADERPLNAYFAAGLVFEFAAGVAWVTIMALAHAYRRPATLVAGPEATLAAT